MAPAFTAFALGPEDIAVVFPLVRAVGGDIELAQWRSFARRIIDVPAGSASGAIGLRSAAGYVCGLVLYRVEHDLRHGPVLAIDLFTALDLFNEERAIRSLIQLVDAKARELSCAATHIRLGTSQKSLIPIFAAEGHNQEATLFCKAVEPRVAAS